MGLGTCWPMRAFLFLFNRHDTHTPRRLTDGEICASICVSIASGSFNSRAIHKCGFKNGVKPSSDAETSKSTGSAYQSLDVCLALSLSSKLNNANLIDCEYLLARNDRKEVYILPHVLDQHSSNEKSTCVSVHLIARRHI